jgi:hypothetical protein
MSQAAIKKTCKTIAEKLNGTESVNGKRFLNCQQ